MLATSARLVVQVRNRETQRGLDCLDNAKRECILKLLVKALQEAATGQDARALNAECLTCYREVDPALIRITLRRGIPFLYEYEEEFPRSNALLMRAFYGNKELFAATAWRMTRPVNEAALAIRTICGLTRRIHIGDTICFCHPQEDSRPGCRSSG